MRHLLAADRVRFGRRKDLWLLVALVPAVLLLLFVMEYNAATTPPNPFIDLEPPDPVAEAQIRDQMLGEWHQQVLTELPAFAFPASLVKVAGDTVPLMLLAIYLSAALVGGEYEWGTVRTIHLTSSRGRTLAVRIGLVAGLVGIGFATALALAAIAPFFLSFEGAPLQGHAQPVPNLFWDIALRVATVLPFVSVPILLAVATRSIATSFLLVVLFFVADIALTGAPFWASSPVPWVPGLTVTGSILRLLGTSDQLVKDVPAGLSNIALVAWITLPVVGAITLFKRQDLTE